jgi:hypothetical protein
MRDQSDVTTIGISRKLAKDLLGIVESQQEEIRKLHTAMLKMFSEPIELTNQSTNVSVTWDDPGHSPFANEAGEWLVANGYYGKTRFGGRYVYRPRPV